MTMVTLDQLLAGTTKAERRRYLAGREAAMTERQAGAAVQARLRRCPDYWAGWFDWRAQAFKTFPDALQLVDPTREGGWIRNPEHARRTGG